MKLVRVTVKKLWIARLSPNLEILTNLQRVRNESSRFSRLDENPRCPYYNPSHKYLYVLRDKRRGFTLSYDVFESLTSTAACLWRINNIKYERTSIFLNHQVGVTRSYRDLSLVPVAWYSSRALRTAIFLLFPRDNCGKWLPEKQSDLAESFCQQIQLRYPVSSATFEPEACAGRPRGRRKLVDTTIPTGPRASPCSRRSGVLE